MEISEAKEQLISLKEDRKSFLNNDKEHDEMFLKDIEAIGTVLQELENSISKNKIREKITKLEKYEEESQGYVLEVHDSIMQQRILKELLKESEGYIHV